MRSFIAATMLVLVAGCTHYEATVIEGAGGEDLSAVPRIGQLQVLPLRMPSEILGDVSAEETQAWPEEGARLVARGITEQTKDEVEALYMTETPASGYYVVVTATRIDAGDDRIPVKNLVSPDKDMRTDVRADCLIINADTGALVAELSFKLGTAYGIEDPVENDFYQLGKSLGDWLQERQ